MSNLKDLIVNFLDKNYHFVYGFSFRYFELETKETINEYIFTSTVCKIFGDNKKVKDILLEWKEKQKTFLEEKLYATLSSMDLSLGSHVLYNEIISNEEIVKKYDSKFLLEKFLEYYKPKNINEMLNNFSTEEYDNSSSLISLTLGNLPKEIDAINKEIENTINLWYYNNVFKNKLDKFFNESTLVLGPRSWLVKHSLYGVFEEQKIASFFKDETNFQKNMIKEQYDVWYEKEIYIVSEMGFNNLYL